MKTRAVQIFEQYINSQKTREQYNYLIGKFVKHGQKDWMVEKAEEAVKEWENSTRWNTGI